MTKQSQIYKCNFCGNVFEVLHEGTIDFVCCNTPMELLVEKTADMATEKHVPVIEKITDGYKVTVGSTLHPMEKDHLIEWIEILANGISYKKFLKPGNKPEAVFKTDAQNITAREYCNLHGLWKNQMS
ncbi:MAG: desulfoferrodoxin [Leptospirales bacterium]|nr:desulfoferrodoxin [Leptospirales bacterium]